MVMNKKRAFLMVIMFSLLFNVVWATEKNRAYACSCAMMPGAYEDELANYDWVFDGVVTSKTEENSILGEKSSADEVEWTLQVYGSWKGEVSELIKVYSAASSISCGYEFKVGKRYAVFATMVDGKLKVFMCSPTTNIADNSKIFVDLGDYNYEVEVPPTVDKMSVNEITADLDVIDAHSPDAVVKIATEEEVKLNIENRKGSVTIVFVVVGLLFLVGAILLVRRLMRR